MEQLLPRAYPMNRLVLSGSRYKYPRTVGTLGEMTKDSRARVGSRLRGTDPLAQGNPKHPPSGGPRPLQGENPSLRLETLPNKLEVRQTRYQPREGA